MWRIFYLVTLVLVVGCAGIDRLSFESQSGLDSELNTLPTNIPNHKISSNSNPEIDAMPELPNLGPAPELTNEVWLNTEQPLRLLDLRGRVVLIDMWTYG